MGAAEERFVRGDDLDLACRLLVVAADVAMGFFGSPTRSELKDDGSPVGEADLAVDAVLVEELRRERPGDGVFSEESGAAGPTAARRWILDPIDGTVAFLDGTEHWGTHIALQEGGEIILGALSRPVTNQRWSAARGFGASRGVMDRDRVFDAPFRLWSERDLADARITGWPVDAFRVPELLAAARWTDCEYNDLLVVLDGRAEVMVVPGDIWDHAPFLILLEEAGGSLIDPRGGRRIDLGAALYTNGVIDRQLRALLWPVRS